MSGFWLTFACLPGRRAAKILLWRKAILLTRSGFFAEQDMAVLAVNIFCGIK